MTACRRTAPRVLRPTQFNKDAVADGHSIGRMQHEHSLEALRYLPMQLVCDLEKG
jgi:hypothetical protein